MTTCLMHATAKDTSECIREGGNTMILDEARIKLERYIRQRVDLLGLGDLSEGLQDLRDVLEGENSPEDKKRAANLVRTYRNEVLGWPG